VDRDSQRAEDGEREAPRLGALRKSFYALGDFTLNVSYSSLSLIYTTYFLTQVADLRPALAGLVPLIGRAVDAFTDPLMGRLSDLTRWRWGRRRPYFLLGALPYGVCFALLWLDVPFASQTARFAYYAVAYCLLSVAVTILSVPYLAIQPEMATDYDERTSLNTYRTIGSILGTVGAVAILPVSKSLGGGAAGFAAAGAVYGLLVALPWLAVHGATFERAGFRTRAVQSGFADTLREVMRHTSFQRLTGIYILTRIAMDLAAALIILYVSFWLGRSADYELVMMLFLGAIVVALPGWLRFATGREKTGIFVAGCTWWMVASFLLAFVQPEWPRWILFVFVPLVAVGYAVVDVMPWSMLGEVIDEDDLQTGERRDGLYNGFFTFIRKLGGAIGVALVMGILDVAGFERGEQQSESARQAIRLLTALGPGLFLLFAVWLARDYPLTREVHARVVAGLRDRQPIRKNTDKLRN
jgi:sugar (glycoside-pentoside-hexuronide) transporter